MAIENVAKFTLWSYRQVKLKFFIKSLYNFRSISSEKMKLECPPLTAYFNKDENGEKFSVSVLVEHTKYSLSRNFTFWRPLDSPLMELLSRVDLKIGNQLERKWKRSPEKFVLPTVKSRMYRDGDQLPGAFPCSSLFEEKGQYVINILGDSYNVYFNSPWVNELILPKTILTNSIIFPRKFACSYTDKKRSTFIWYRSEKLAAYINADVTKVNEWVEVGQNYCYKVQDQDVGHYLKLVCIPQNENSTGPKFMGICTSPVTASRLDYHFLQTHLLTKDKVDNSKIRIVTYNLLADTYATTKEAKTMFDYCSPEVLQKDTRYSTLAWEVTGYNADLICLQEVENSNHTGYLSCRLEDEGYGSDFCPKAHDREGTACYYNKSKFNLVTSEKYVLGQEITMNRFLKNVYDYLKQKEELFTRFNELPHCMQILVLQSQSRQDQLLIVANVHLFSYPDADLIRLLQAICSFCLYEYTVEKLREKKKNGNYSFILCGDFNSTPECSIHQMVLNGSISAEDPIWSSDEMKGAKGISYKLPLNMASAFNDVKFTNYTRVFKGCLDYIYYHSDLFEVSQTYSLPDEDVLSAEVGLPSHYFPSDHLPLIAELKWKR